MRGRRMMDVNPDHPIIKDLSGACKNAPESSEVKTDVDFLYETTLIASGFTPDSPAELGGKIYEMMAVALGGKWGRVEESEAAAADHLNQVQARLLKPLRRKLWSRQRLGLKPTCGVADNRVIRGRAIGTCRCLGRSRNFGLVNL